MSTRERILAVVGKVAQKPIPADPEESLFESGVVDSFGLPDMVTALEEEFGVKIPDADLNPRKFDSLARIESYVNSRS